MNCCAGSSILRHLEYWPSVRLPIRRVRAFSLRAPRIYPQMGVSSSQAPLLNSILRIGSTILIGRMTELFHRSASQPFVFRDGQLPPVSKATKFLKREPCRFRGRCSTRASPGEHEADPAHQDCQHHYAEPQQTLKDGSIIRLWFRQHPNPKVHQRRFRARQVRPLVSRQGW